MTEALNLSSSGDALVLQFDEPTNRPLAVEGSLSAAAVERLLDFSPPVLDSSGLRSTCGRGGRRGALQEGSRTFPVGCSARGTRRAGA